MVDRSFASALKAGAAVGTLALAFAAPAQAQQMAAAGGLEEIVVTAQRRAENVQDVPVAVTALTGDALAKNDVRDLSRVEVLTPGFSFGKSGSDARPAIRGVRTENVGVSGDPTIGFFVDNVYRSRASMANEPFVDVERVEVQRGPQGTLYGRNTFGGNVAISTAAPTNRTEGAVKLTLGQYQRAAGEGFINVPISDVVQLRVAGLREVMDGYVKGVTENLDIFDRDTAYVRGALRVDPGNGFEAVLRASHWEEQGTGGAAFGYRVGGIFVNPTTGAFDINGQPFLLRYDLPRNNRPLTDGIPIDTRKLFYPGDTVLEQDLNQDSFNANLSYDAGPVVLRSITGYTEFEVFRNADNDFSTRLGNVDGQEDKLDAFSQELQVASGDDSPLQWIAGYFYFKEDVNASFFSSCPTAQRNAPGCAFAAGLPETTSNAVFGQASYWLVEDVFRLTGGVRYTKDKKEITRANATTDANQRLVDVIPTGQAFDFSFTKTTWRVNGEYHATDDNMLYATVSTGFRSGGFNAGFFTNPALPGAFGPENVTAYEIGAKNRFLDNRLQLNVSAYYNDFKDLQVQNQFLVPSPTGGFTTTSVILNAASAHSKGIELELEAVPVDNLNIGMSATFMRAKYDNYANVPAPANYTGFLDYSDNRIPYSPRVKLTGTVSYDIDAGAAGTFTPQVTALYSGSYYNTDTNTVLDRQDSFAKLDLRIGWTSASETYTLEAFVNNVTDEVTLNRATFGSRGLNQSYDAPRMWGVRAGAKF
ncbi:MAG TPA: TonB-dependent receptor [Azospirillaceae bacterium]|nr:TonB-dependent receptor [Azospirillaceae bacterium]